MSVIGTQIGASRNAGQAPSFPRKRESRGVGRGECSAGACPPLGRMGGVAESAVPIRRTKPQLQLFIPWCAGASRHERLVRKCALTAFECASDPPSVIPAKAGIQRGGERGM